MLATINFPNAEKAVGPRDRPDSRSDAGGLVSSWFVGDDHGITHAEGYKCFCAVGNETGYPLKLFSSFNPQEALRRIRYERWDEVIAHDLVWAPHLLTLRLEAEAKRILDKAGKRLMGAWFAITPEWFSKVVSVAAGNIGVEVMSHDSFFKHLVKLESVSIKREL